MKSGDFFRVINKESRYFGYYGKIIRLGPIGQAKCLVFDLKIVLDSSKDDESRGSMVVLNLEELIEASDEVEAFKVLNA